MATKYTPEERQTIATVLKEAKKYLWDGKFPSRQPDSKKTYICFAINAAVSWSDLPLVCSNARAITKSVVIDRLRSFTTVNEYLRYTLGVHPRLLTDQNIQSFRHRWLDSLILEFSK